MHVSVYAAVTGWESFESTLSRIEAIDYADLWRCAADIPHEWIEYDGEGLFRLIEALHRRRRLVRDLIHGFFQVGRLPSVASGASATHKLPKIDLDIPHLFLLHCGIKFATL